MADTSETNGIPGRVLDLAARIQQVAAPTFKERKRAEFVRDLFEAQGMADVTMDAVHNVYARLPGRRQQRPLLVTAHLDTVFSSRRLSLTRGNGQLRGPGIGDNALGVAALLGLVWMLHQADVVLDADVWLIANSCEEGLGDLRGMQAVVDRFGFDALGFLVLEGTALGQVYHRGLGVRRFRVSVSTGGGHAWSDHGSASAIHEAAQLVTALTALPLPRRPRTTLNVGTISGGTGVNVLASEAHFELDVRSENPAELEILTGNVERIVAGRRRAGVEVKLASIGQRPFGGLPADHPWVQIALDCLHDLGLTGRLASGSTDANIPLSLGIPAVVLGITTGGGTHTLQEYVDTAPVGQGLEQMACFVQRVLELT